MLRNAAGDVLLGMQNEDGTFSNDASVNFVTNQADGIFNFTVTPSLAAALSDYACQVHTNSMVGQVTAN